MKPWDWVKVYRRANRVANLVREANMSKSLWKSKTFWFNLLTAGAELTQTLAQVQLVPPGGLAVAAAVINIGLRLVTDQPVHVGGARE